VTARAEEERGGAHFRNDLAGIRTACAGTGIHSGSSTENLEKSPHPRDWARRGRVPDHTGKWSAGDRNL